MSEAVRSENEVLPFLPQPKRGSRIPKSLTEDQWRKLGGHLGATERTIMWDIGEWWIVGEEKKFEKPKPDSEEWKALGWPAYGTCRNAGTVCRRFPVSRRRDNLSFNFHAEVAGIDDESAVEQLLNDAESDGWTKQELRAAVHRYKNRRSSTPISDPCSVDDLHVAVAAGKKFGCFYADPPWRYDNQGTRAKTSDHYEGMSIDELCAMPIGDLSLPDAHLHLWVTNAFLFDAAPPILRAWGFEFKSTFVWCKPTIGIGNYWRNSHEIMLTAIRGNARSFHDHSMRSWIECERGAHSEKPAQMHGMLERASSGPYLELFARTDLGTANNDNWSKWGNEVTRSQFHGES